MCQRCFRDASHPPPAAQLTVGQAISSPPAAQLTAGQAISSPPALSSPPAPTTAGRGNWQVSGGADPGQSRGLRD